jgi:xylose dehydrogenase (NAD/NADP)
MSAETTRWGILGTGMIAKVLADAIGHADNAELVAVGSRKLDIAQAFAADRGVPTAHGSYDELLADPNVDVVYVSLPNTLHCEWTIKAAEAGKHVLCEKPLAISVDECERMLAAAEANDVRLMEGFMYRCHPQTMRLREIVDEGRIGELRIVHSTFSFSVSDPSNIRLSKPLHGGGLMDVGCYCVNLVRFIAGAEPIAVFGAAAYGDESGVDESFAGTLVFDSGAFGQFDVGVKSAGRSGAGIVGSTGRIAVPAPWKPREAATVTVHDASGAEEVTIQGGDPYVLEVEHFSRCVTEGERPILSRADSIGNMAAICALHESARTGEVVRL